MNISWPTQSSNALRTGTKGLFTLKRAALFLYFFLAGCMLSTVTALAYIDPSAMTYMIQLAAGVAIAAGAGAGYYFRRFKRKFFRRSKGAGRTAPPSWEDDDDTGYGDYEIDAPVQDQQGPSPVPAAESPSYAPPSQAFGPQPAQAPVGPLYANDTITADPDPYDETGGTAGLLAENRELRRLLALERQNVEELKRALHICTRPGR